MPMTEDELRTALRQIPAALPTAPDRLRGVEQRVRRHRRRVVASVAAGVALVLVAVPLVRQLADDRQRDALPVGPAEVQVRDAMMQYAAFVAYWDGMTADPSLSTDSGVEGIVVSRTLPPMACTVASPAPGEPAGTQAAWVLGTGSVIPQPGEPVVVGDIAVVSALWPVGVTTCDPRPASATALALPPPMLTTGGIIASDVAASQSLAAPSRPALDVAAVYHRIPEGRVTDHGREVFAMYASWRDALDFGTPTEQNERVLSALLDWIAVAMVSTSLTPSPATGPVLLRSTDYVGTAQLPAGYSARWDGAKLCIQGSVGGSPVQHVSEASHPEPGGATEYFDGPCPA